MSLMQHMHVSFTFDLSSFKNKSLLCVPLMWHSNFVPTVHVIPVFLEIKCPQTLVCFNVHGRVLNS